MIDTPREQVAVVANAITHTIADGTAIVNGLEAVRGAAENLAQPLNNLAFQQARLTERLREVWNEHQVRNEPQRILFRNSDEVTYRVARADTFVGNSAWQTIPVWHTEPVRRDDHVGMPRIYGTITGRNTWAHPFTVHVTDNTAVGVSYLPEEPQIDTAEEDRKKIEEGLNQIREFVMLREAVPTGMTVYMMVGANEVTITDTEGNTLNETFADVEDALDTVQEQGYLIGHWYAQETSEETEASTG